MLDFFVHARFQSKPQLWNVDGWYQKFGMADNPEDRGVGWTAEQVAAWTPPSRDVTIGYYEAVKTGLREYLSAVTDADLEKVMVIPPRPEPHSITNAVGMLVWESIAHGGQIAYLRGLYKGMGWHR